MNIDAKQLRMIPFFWPFTRNPRFQVRGNSVQVQETGLVVQGFVRKLSMPIMDILIHPVLSEWTCLTIPYSRIRSFRYRSFFVLRLILSLLAWTPCGLLLFFALANWRHAESWGMLLGAFMFGVLGLLLTVYVNIQACVPRFNLSFDAADGRVTRLRLRVRNRKLRKQFQKAVERNREQALYGMDDVIDATEVRSDKRTPL